MSTLASNHCLLKRGDTYHFRLPVPKKLVAVVGRTAITQSLKTSNVKAARKHRDLLYVGWTTQFESLSGGHNGLSEPLIAAAIAAPEVPSERLSS